MSGSLQCDCIDMIGPVGDAVAMQMHRDHGVRTARRVWDAGSRFGGEERTVGRLFVVDAHFRPGLPRLARLLYRRVTGANGDDVLSALRDRFDRVEPVFGADGERVPFGEVSWPPPVAAALATKAS